MYVIKTYRDILMSLSDKAEKIIVFILTKPNFREYNSTDNTLINKHNFSYFNQLSGTHVDFFLPGYVFGYDFLGKEIHLTNSASRLFRKPFRIFFDEQSFCDFKELFEQNIHYRYSGHDELIVTRYIPKTEQSSGYIDFNNFSKYDLLPVRTRYANANAGWDATDGFISQVINICAENKAYDDIKNKIDREYCRITMSEERNISCENYTLEYCDYRNDESIEKMLQNKGKYMFISYSTKHAEYARKINEMLCSFGINTWLAPGDIPHGSSYADVITAAIRYASGVCLLLCNEACQSVWVEKELCEACSLLPNKIFPIRLFEDIVLSNAFQYCLSNIQIPEFVFSKLNDSEQKIEIQKIVEKL